MIFSIRGNKLWWIFYICVESIEEGDVAYTADAEVWRVKKKVKKTQTIASDLSK